MTRTLLGLGPSAGSRLDQLQVDQALRRADLEVEVPEEVHPDQAVDVLVCEREDRECKVWRRRVENGELGDVNPVAAFFPIAV